MNESTVAIIVASISMLASLGGTVFMVFFSKTEKATARKTDTESTEIKRRLERGNVADISVVMAEFYEVLDIANHQILWRQRVLSAHPEINGNTMKSHLELEARLRASQARISAHFKPEIS